MFQLVVAVISIALVVVLAVAAIWIGGGAFADSRQRALYSEQLNSAAQIDGALQLYYQEKGRFPVETDDALLGVLVQGNFLKSAPKGDWKVSVEELYKPVDDENQCKVLNTVAGVWKDGDLPANGCPACDSADHKKWPGCMVSTTP